jgi:hypothetical protein
MHVTQPENVLAVISRMSGRLKPLDTLIGVVTERIIPQTKATACHGSAYFCDWSPCYSYFQSECPNTNGIGYYLWHAPDWHYCPNPGPPCVQCGCDH